ncbi:hypothetical protein [Pseudomonas syringae]|uniref:hypothetical protein n=1 Tax=Pseudomonas syringae TaxID=317 RepID=UPI0032D903D1
MDGFESLWPFPGPVVAALIAGFISFVVTVLAKDQKTSEFRQAWIDGLRTDVSELAGTAFAMSSVLRVKHSLGENTTKYILERHDDFLKMEALATKIQLRLNPKEHIELIALLKTFSDPDGTQDDNDKNVANIVSAIHVELGLEWKRVKRGEPSFRILKWLSFSTILAGAVAGLIVAYRYLIL